MKESLKSKAYFIFSMVVFGTIGIFRRYLPFESGMIAFSRGITGAAFLLLLILLKKQKPDWGAIKKNAVLLCVSGAFIGSNWILLFEAYNFTSVATATLCYYMAPVIVIIISPFVLKERLTLKKVFCVISSLVGMILVSGIVSDRPTDSGNFKGILFGLGAALLYAAVMTLNQKIHNIGAYDKTIVQLLSAALVILPYTLLKENVNPGDVNIKTVSVLLFVGIFHTGISYALYFGSMDKMNSQTVALFSYIDPIVAVILSAVLLKEKAEALQIIGTVLILGSMIFSEIDFKNTKTHRAR